MKLNKLWYFLVLPVVLALSTGCDGGATTTSNPGSFYDDTKQAALDFIQSSPTYFFDGIPETLVVKNTMYITDTLYIEYTYEFDSRHAGYGDRTGQALAQVITHHSAVISINGGKVVEAVMDEYWDMLNQIPLVKATGNPNLK